ncbi:MAG: hypothetical protein JSV83_07430 [Desulfobacterales bacterium]|nr:MAG: hypothetical protein JSV83_07430 [Desulfobacterales bacterium]
MLELDQLTNQVLHNCEISDSRHAGLYSICGLALRLRDLYKWEKGLSPWDERESPEILEWIGNKEQKWENIVENDYTPLSIMGCQYDPFETKAINAVLEPYDLFYGAGYAHSLKPTFFLATINDKRNVCGYSVYILGRELARDLLTIPALSQDSCILLRKESASMFLWDQLLYIKRSRRPALKFALENCGINDQHPKALRSNLDKILAAQQETYIYHEIGEITDTVFERGIWREVVAAFPHTAVELLARAVKDLLADTNKYGTLRYFIQTRKSVPLALYVAFLGGLPKALFPELTAGFQEYIQTGNWQIIENAVSAGYNNAKHYAEEIIRIFTAGKQKNDAAWAKDQIEKRLMQRLQSATQVTSPN